MTTLERHQREWVELQSCSRLREWLEGALLGVLAQPVAETPRAEGLCLHPQRTRIAVDVRPYGSAEEADAAEPAIAWFSRKEEDRLRQRACRLGFAALELQRYLRRIAGCEGGFEIGPLSASGGGGEVVLRLEAAQEWQHTDGRFQIVQESPGVYMIRGLSIQGCLYGVYEYLHQLGCQFLRPGSEGERVAVGRPIAPPVPTRQTPSFYWRRLHGWRKNRATPELIDWMGKARINTWGADNLVPGMRKRGILLASGMHDVLAVAGLDDGFNILDEDQRRRLVEGLIDAFARGPWREADICEYIGADWGRRPRVNFAGNNADLEILALHAVREGFRRAYQEGRIDRDVFVSGYAYFDCEDPPRLPMPDGFDAAGVAVEFWSMRCWRHLLDEEACDEPFPIISTMNNYAGQRFELPSNRRIGSRIAAWLEGSAFNARFGVGYYLSNAGNYYMPLGLTAVLTHELPMLHAMGARQINYMHISPSDWGPKAVTNWLYSRLAWDVQQDPVTLLADYFRASYQDQAGTMARAYFLLERATADLPLIKRFVVNRIQTQGSLAAIKSHSHMPGEDDEAHRKAVPSLRRCAAWAQQALELARSAGDSAGWAEQDLPWFAYAADTVELFRLVLEAWTLYEAGDPQTARQRLDQTQAVIDRLRALKLDLSLPEKIRVDAAEASLLMPVCQKLAVNLNNSLRSSALSAEDLPLQAGVMPVTSGDRMKARASNPKLRCPDPSWPMPGPLDRLGCQWGTLIETGVKHQGIVAQTVQGRLLLASVGEDWRGTPSEWGTRNRCSLVCFTGQGRLLWRHDFARPGYRVSNGPWPAFVDLTGHGDWAVSVFVIEDGGPGRRAGFIRLYDAATGQPRWEHRIPDHDYPGGNGSCAAADLDGDGRIELVYGLCNLILCLDAQTGREKWRYDDRIKICHGRFALADLYRDGRLQIIAATEYGDRPDDPACDRSSILALDGQGRLLRRLSNIQGDLGSTQIVAIDVDHDGRLEIVHGSENLVYHEPRHMGELFVLEPWVTPKLDTVPTGGARFAVGDVDGDGYPEAVGITNYRDGGPFVRPEVFCVRVLDGRVKWRAPLPRVWLDGDAIMADFDGDGRLEIAVTANYPSGYLHQPGTEPWSDLYILRGDGQILHQHTCPDSAISPIAVDVDQDGRMELIVPCYDGKVYQVRTSGPSAPGDWPLACQNAQRTGVAPQPKR